MWRLISQKILITDQTTDGAEKRAEYPKNNWVVWIHFIDKTYLEQILDIFSVKPGSH